MHVTYVSIDRLINMRRQFYVYHCQWTVNQIDLSNALGNDVQHYVTCLCRSADPSNRSQLDER